MTVRQAAPDVQPQGSSRSFLNDKTSQPLEPHETDPGNAPKPPTARQIATWLALFVEDSQVFEIRAPKATRPGRKGTENVVRRFTSNELAEAAREALRLSARVPGVYFTLNPIRPDLDPAQAATDRDILRRIWLLIDADPRRPAETSATEQEKAAARARAEAVLCFLTALGWPEPIGADPGNGAHLLYRIDLPADDEGLVKAVLEVLAARFDTATCTIDRKVYNSSRICKLYGTEARKGPNTPERPHRFSRVVTVPAEVQVVPVELLKALVAEGRPVKGTTPAPPATDRRAGRGPGRGSRPFDVEAHASRYMAKCQPAISGQGGHNQTLKVAIEIGPGFDLAPDVAFRLLWAEYNPRCEPPWSERDLRRKVDEAYRVEARRGWHLDELRNGRGAHRNGKGNGRAGDMISPSAPPGPTLPATRADGGRSNPTKPPTIPTDSLAWSWVDSSIPKAQRWPISGKASTCGMGRPTSTIPTSSASPWSER